MACRTVPKNLCRARVAPHSRMVRWSLQGWRRMIANSCITPRLTCTRNIPQNRRGGIGRRRSFRVLPKGCSPDVFSARFSFFRVLIEPPFTRRASQMSGVNTDVPRVSSPCHVHFSQSRHSSPVSMDHAKKHKFSSPNEPHRLHGNRSPSTQLSPRSNEKFKLRQGAVVELAQVADIVFPIAV